MARNRIAAFIALSVVAASPAMAGSVDGVFTGTGLGKSVKINLDGKKAKVFAGQLKHHFSNGTGDGSSLDGTYLTFCTELKQYVTKITKPFNVMDLQHVPNTSPMGMQKAQAIKELFAFADGAQYATKATSFNKNFAAAFQIAIWEIVQDYDGTLASLNVSSGHLKVTKKSGTMTSILADLFGSIGSGHGASGLLAVTNVKAQDQLVMVPLPAGLLLGMAGLAGVVVARRRMSRPRSA